MHPIDKTSSNERRTLARWPVWSACHFYKGLVPAGASVGATCPTQDGLLKRLPQFAGSNVTKRTPEQHAALLSFMVEQYQAGRSLRELAELTGRTQIAVRRALDQAGVPRRSRGANPVSVDHNEGQRSDDRV